MCETKEPNLRRIDVLDKGFVRLVDYMGNDTAIVQAARVSYGEGTKTVRQDKGLIQYLIRNQHTSPLEMVELKFHARMPISTARQWVRHRTASINEYSTRYSEVVDDFYIPDLDRWRVQDAKNKQASGADRVTNPAEASSILDNVSNFCYNGYRQLLNMGVARESARDALSLNFYTEWYWKIDLKNLLHFLSLRNDSHAQFEIQQYAIAIQALITPIVPWTMEAWSEFQTMWKYFIENYQEFKEWRETHAELCN